MPLFEIATGRDLLPFRKLRGPGELYEREIEDLLWDNLEELTGETLLPVARQPNIASGGRPDIVALDEQANVVVIEVKRDVDRGQLAQCLEYAGWARSTSLDELARLYHRGQGGFFSDWQAFTESDAPVVLMRRPRLVLVAGDFHGRTESAFDYLIENGVPVHLVRALIYEDAGGRRFVDVEGDHEPTTAMVPDAAKDSEPIRHTTVGGRRIQLADLLDAGLLQEGERLVLDPAPAGRTTPSCRHLERRDRAQRWPHVRHPVKGGERSGGRSRLTTAGTPGTSSGIPT